MSTSTDARSCVTDAGEQESSADKQKRGVSFVNKGKARTFEEPHACRTLKQIAHLVKNGSSVNEVMQNILDLFGEHKDVFERFVGFVPPLRTAQSLRLCGMVGPTVQTNNPGQRISLLLKSTNLLSQSGMEAVISGQFDLKARLPAESEQCVVQDGGSGAHLNSAKGSEAWRTRSSHKRPIGTHVVGYNGTHEYYSPSGSIQGEIHRTLDAINIELYRTLQADEPLSSFYGVEECVDLLVTIHKGELEPKSICEDYYNIVIKFRQACAVVINFAIRICEWQGLKLKGVDVNSVSPSKNLPPNSKACFIVENSHNVRTIGYHGSFKSTIQGQSESLQLLSARGMGSGTLAQVLLESSDVVEKSDERIIQEGELGAPSNSVRESEEPSERPSKKRPYQEILPYSTQPASVATQENPVYESGLEGGVLVEALLPSSDTKEKSDPPIFQGCEAYPDSKPVRESIDCIEDNGFVRLGQNRSQQLPTGNLLLPGRQWVFERRLRKADLSAVAKITLNRYPGEVYPIMADNEVLEILLHDGHEEGKTWNMKLTSSTAITGARYYRLENPGEYSKHHALREGDRLRIYWDEQGARYSPGYSLEIERYVTDYIPPSLERHRMAAKDWYLVYEKQLTMRDYESHGE